MSVSSRCQAPAVPADVIGSSAGNTGSSPRESRRVKSMLAVAILASVIAQGGGQFTPEAAGDARGKGDVAPGRGRADSSAAVPGSSRRSRPERRRYGDCLELRQADA